MKIVIKTIYLDRTEVTITGRKDIKENDPVLQKVIECEQTLEELTGLRFYIVAVEFRTKEEVIALLERRII